VATRIFFDSRAKAAQWASLVPSGLLGQIKRGKGPPTKTWEQLTPNMEAVPDGQPWLIKRADGVLARVCFDRNSDGDAAYGTARASKMLSELIDSVERVTGIVGAATRMQQDISTTLLELQSRMSDLSDRQDKTTAEVIKATSVHKLVENVFARLMSYVARKDGHLSAEDSQLLEKLMIAMGEKRARETVSSVCDTVGVSVENAEETETPHGEEAEVSGDASTSAADGGRRYPRRTRRNSDR